MGCGDDTIPKLLKEYGADATLKDWNGRTAADLRIECEKKRCKLY